MQNRVLVEQQTGFREKKVLKIKCKHSYERNINLKRKEKNLVSRKAPIKVNAKKFLFLNIVISK